VRRPILAACLLVAACEPTFDNAHVIDELRVLAVRAEPPEAGVGEPVHLEALVASPHGGPVEVHMWQCAARGGMRQGCETFDDSLDLGPGTTADMVVSEDWRARLDRAGGLAVQLVLTVVAEYEDEVARAIKRIVVSDEERKNENPVLEALLLEDEETEVRGFVVAPGAAVHLHPIVGEGSVEAYDKIRLDGTRSPATETLFLSHYYGCGSVANLRSGGPENLGATWRAPSEPGRCSIYAILRDDRGGVDFRVREIVVE
jgi:hypothetical protein